MVRRWDFLWFGIKTGRKKWKLTAQQENQKEYQGSGMKADRKAQKQTGKTVRKMEFKLYGTKMEIKNRYQILRKVS